uniref:RAD51 associated protein 2 n=1 Tax=Oryctolagus cuniculus TaxID=9986 RepID=G1TSL3_RABIT|nr:RAD51-associated protein 2 [Oryctolagus cuniculus]
MSFAQRTPRPARLRRPANLSPPLEDACFQPPSGKRLRLEQSGGVPEAGWQLPWVPRLTEEEKAWELSPRPFKALLFLKSAIFDDATDSCVEKSVNEKQIGRQGCPLGEFQRNSCGQARPSGSSDCGLGAPGGSEPAPCGIERVGERFRVKAQAEIGHLVPRAQLEAGKRHLVQEGDDVPRGKGYVRQAENPFLAVTFFREAKSSSHEIGNRCNVDSVMSSNIKENNVSSSILKISKSPNQPSLEIAKPSYFRARSTMRIPNFPSDLNSKMSFVYLKEIAEKKNDKSEAYVRDFTNIYWSQNRPDVKKQKLQDDTKIVDMKKIVSECYESNHQSLSNQNNFERKKDLIGLNYYNHSSTKRDVRHCKKNFTIILENANWEEAKTHLGSYFLSNLEVTQSWDCITRHILKVNGKNLEVINNDRVKCENMKRSREKLNLLQLFKMSLLSKEGYHNTIVMNVFEKQAKPFMIKILGSQKTLLKALWLYCKGENNMLQLRCCTTQKYFHVSHIFQSVITEILNFHISGNQKDNRILTWYNILKYKKQTVVQNLITRNTNADIKRGILNIYLQTILELLKITMKASRTSLVNNFDYLTRLENDSELEKGCLLKCKLYLNYPKIMIVKRHTVYPIKILTFSRQLEDVRKPIIKKRKLFTTEQAIDRSKEKNSNSFSTANNICFPIFEMCEKNPLKDFDDMKGISLAKEISYKNINVANLAPCSSNTATTHIKSDSQYIQNNHGCVSEKYYDINMHNQVLDTERKWKQKETNMFSSKCIFEDFVNVRPWAVPARHSSIHSVETNDVNANRVLNFGKLLSEKEGKNYDSVLEEEVKFRAQGLTNSFQVHKDINIEKEGKDSSFPIDSMLSMQTVLLMGTKVDVEKMKTVQNNTIDRNEYDNILEESELTTNHFHLKNNSTLCMNHQFETDSSEGNKECFQDLTAKCLSTESLTMVKDFEMKSKFDLVLEELRMFHEISKENEVLSRVETNSEQKNYFGESNGVEEVKMEMEKDLKMVAVKKTCTSSLCDTIAGPKVYKRHQNLFKWKMIPENTEQEVPHGCLYPRTSEEGSLSSTSEEGCEKPLPKKRTFSPDECKEEKLNCLSSEGSHFSQGISRVQPLMTCSRPIRIGLSRKAKPKQLHPYLK